MERVWKNAVKLTLALNTKKEDCYKNEYIMILVKTKVITC